MTPGGKVPEGKLNNGMVYNIGRRRLLAAIARLPALWIAGWAGLLPRFAPAQEASGDASGTAGQGKEHELGMHDLAVLEQLAWLLFPIPELGAGPYQRVAAGIAAAVRGQLPQFTQVHEGIEQLDAAAGGSFLDLPEPAQVEQLQQIEAGEFFQFVYAAVRSGLFDDREVWALLGYEGSSLEKGGYLNRGLNDIDWL
jgi:hypothetical protein